MRIIARRTIRDFWRSDPSHYDAAGPLKAWYAEARAADWAKPADVKAQFGQTSILKGGRVVFNIAGNKYRLVVWINYAYRAIYIRFVGTHRDYDKINAETI